MATQTQTHTMESGHRHSSKGELIHEVEKDTKPLQEFFTKFNNDWSMNFAGLIAYSLLMAILPIAIAIIAILGFVLGNSSNHIISQVTGVFPGLAGQQNALLLAKKQLQSSAGVLAIIAVLLAIFGGSRLFITIEGCLDIIYRVRPRAVIQQNLMAFGMFILFIILIPIMVFAGALPSVILSLSQIPALSFLPFIHVVAGNLLVTHLGVILGGLIAAFILMEAIYFIVPNQHISWRNSWRGALVAAIALEIFFNLFPVYSRFFLKNYVGQIGFAVILLLFFYYFAVILMLGAEVNAFFFEHVRPLPNDLATFVSTMGGKLNQDIPESEAGHMDTRPTDKADRAHVGRILEEGKQVQQKNAQKQHEVVSKNRGQDKGKEKSGSKGPTVVEIVAGTALALIVALFETRRRGK